MYFACLEATQEKKIHDNPHVRYMNNVRKQN